MSIQAQRVALLRRVGYEDLGELEPGWRVLSRHVAERISSYVFLGPHNEARYSNECDIKTAWPLSDEYLQNLTRRFND